MMKPNRLVSCLLVTLSVLAAECVRSQTWSPQIASSPVSHFSAVNFVNDQMGWISGAFGVILKTTNSGLTWVWQQSGTGLHFSDQDFVNSQTGWVVGQNGVILKTTDGGTTWNAQASGTSAWLNFVEFVDANTGWAAGTAGTVIKTTNGGTTWSLQAGGGAATIEGGDFVNSNSGILACDDGSLMKTTNGGSSWFEQTTGSSQGLNSLCFANPSTGWICGDGGRILGTTNGGASWFGQTSGTTANLNAICFPHPDTGWVVGDGGFIARTTNGGTTWNVQASLANNNLREADFTNPRHGYAVGLYNTVLEYAVVHAVPIQLASFSATVLNTTRVRLEWRTLSELNNYGFEVERSAGSPDNFAVLAGSFLPGNGTTNEPHAYLYTDNSSLMGRSYYRLKQIDLDGTINYTEPISVDVLSAVGENELPMQSALKQNYPNPFNPSTQIEFSVARQGLVSLKVYDLLGREIATILDEELSQGSYTRTFSAEGLSSGVYVYRLSATGYAEARRFVLSK